MSQCPVRCSPSELFILLGLHLGQDKLGHLESTLNVDFNNVFNNLVALLGKGSGNIVVGANVVDYVPVNARFLVLHSRLLPKTPTRIEAIRSPRRAKSWLSPLVKSIA